MLVAAVIERRHALQAKFQLAPNRLHHAVDLVKVGFLPRRISFHRHEVDDFTDPDLAQKAREQDVGVGKVHLPLPCFDGWADAEVATLVGVQNGRKQAGGVEVRNAVPVDRSIGGHQRGRMLVANDTMTFDGSVPPEPVGRASVAALAPLHNPVSDLEPWRGQT